MLAKLWKSGYEMPCQTYTCTRPAGWMIGANPDTLGMNLFLCQGCAESLFESMLGSEVGRRVLERLSAAHAVSPPAPAPGEAVPAPVDVALICPDCGKGPFKSLGGLKGHMRLAHKHAK